MILITSPSEIDLTESNISVFLAGGISKCKEWQNEVIESIKTSSFESSLKDIIFFNPRRADFNISKENLNYEVRKQIEWEFNKLESMSIFSMYFCNSESPQPICFYELGRNILNMQNRFPEDWTKRVIITVEEGFSRVDDVMIQTNLATGMNDIAQIGDIKSHSTRIIKAYMQLIGSEQ